MNLKPWSLLLLLVAVPLAFADTSPKATKSKPSGIVEGPHPAPVPKGPSMEATARKQRSLAKLKAEEVPTTPDWPALPDSATAKIRTKEEVAQRAVAVCFTALKAEGASQDTLEGLVRRYKAKKFFTPAEWEFIDNNAQTNDDRNRYLWRYEGLAVLMWALGYADELPRPDRTCDVRATVAPLSNRTIEQFIAEANLRPIGDLLDVADLTYRYNGAVEDAKRRGAKAPAGLDRGVVRERHAMLSWLIGQP